MSMEVAGDSNLENIMSRLMEYQSGESTDHIDTMIMISLVNLLGIISAMNKQVSSPQAVRSAGEDRMITALLSALAQGQAQQGRQGGMQGITPALLMSLLGSRGQRPENAVLVALLSSLMQQPSRPQRCPDRDRPDQSSPPPGKAKKQSEGGQITKEKEIRVESNHPGPWDWRLK